MDEVEPDDFEEPEEDVEEDSQGDRE